jgi:UDP-N-acetylmuramate dehydrogenase
MLVTAGDPNRRSAGSFFMNPIVDAHQADEVAARADAGGSTKGSTQGSTMPRWPAGDGRVKLSAGWLIERAGIARGLRRGPVGLSSAHALALVHHGGGTTAALVALAREVAAAVQARFGVVLVPEPTFLGTAWNLPPA